jgi:zinc protease
MQRLTELLYPTHPYRREVIGTAEVIATIPRADIKAYYRRWYRPAQMVTLVAGELEPDEVLASVAAAFAFPEERPAVADVPPPDAAPPAPRTARISLPLNVAYVILGYLGPPSADQRAVVALDTISLLLGEGMSSRIQQRLVEQLPNTPFVDAGSSHWTYRASSQILSYGVVRADAAAQATDLLRAEVARLHTEPPTTEEFAKAVTRLESQFAAQAETAAGLCNALADSMARLNAPDGYTEYLPILRSLTPGDLADYARQYLPHEQVCIVTVGPDEA